MALAKREKVLAAITGALVLVSVIYLLVAGVGSHGNLRADREKLANDIEDKKEKACKAIGLLARWKNDPSIKAETMDLALFRRHIRKTADRLAAWEAQALPSDKDEARLLYRSWLRETVDRAEFRGVKFDPGESRTQRDIYTVFPVTVHCRATLEQLTRFLYDFYSAGHLHRISLLTIKPDQGDLDLSISIEGLSLPGADRKDKLNAGPAGRLAFEEFSDYRDAIVERNLFAAYVPPRPVVKRRPRESRPPPPPPPPRPPAFDHTKYTVVTGITGVDGRRQAWIEVRTTGKKLQLFEGETFSAGPVTGTIRHIGQQNVEIEVDGKQRLVGIGQSVADGAELPE